MGGAPRMDERLLSTTAAAELIRRRELSARNLTEAVLARIETTSSTLNAVVELRAEIALAEADAADRTVASGATTGALHGVPVTIKESIRVAGMRSTWGNPAFEGFVAGADATVVRRLRAAGAIVVGTTNAAFMLSDVGRTANPVYGVTSNPWDPDRTPGGSSGGAAAAVASGSSFLDLGSDLAGSIRVPAAFCGVYGLRPSAGIVPLTGFQPPDPPGALTPPDAPEALAPPSERTYLSTVGPFGRSAADLRTTLRVIAGPELPATHAYAWRLARPRRDRLADFRIGVVLDDPACPVSHDAAAVLSDTIDALAGAGVIAVHGWPEGIDPADSYAAFGAQVQLFFAHATPDGSAGGVSEVDEEQRRMALRAAWARYFADVDVFLCPTTFTTAFPHDHRPYEARTISSGDGERRYDELTFWIAHPAVAGLPAVSAPVGRTAGGLPVGLQVVGPIFEDDTAITFAELLANLVGGYEPPAAGSRTVTSRPPPGRAVTTTAPA